MDYQFLKIDNNDFICTLTISAEKSLNALNTKILSEIDDFLDHLDEKTRVLIITGAGEKAFVAGADISEMSNLNGEEGRKFGKYGADVFYKIETLPIPVIAAVNGFALGGGCELAMACDIRIASSKAKFGQPEVGLGIIPGFSGTYRLPRLVGLGNAKELIYTGKAIRADDALRIGLVNRVVEPENLMEETVALAKQIIAKSASAVAAAKLSINTEYNEAPEKAIEMESLNFGKCFDNYDQKEGMKAFLEKRNPDFKDKVNF